MIVGNMGVKSRNILSVELLPEVNAALNRACKETSLAKKDVIARMLTWYAAQVPEVQSIVIGHTPASLIPAAQEIALLQLRENPLAEHGSNANIGGHGLKTINGVTRSIRPEP